MSVSMRDPSWNDAACNGQDPRYFFPEGHMRSASYRAAKAISRRLCEACPITSQCLDYALTETVEADNEAAWVDGMWAGTTPQQREELRG